MLFLRPSHAPFPLSQLVNPSFAYMLANPLEGLRYRADDDNTNSATMYKSDAKTENTHTRIYMQVSEEDERFLLYTDLPGVKPEDLTVELTNKGVLRIHGERKKPSQKPVSFDRQFLVDEKIVDFSKISATFSDGSLEIVAPKKQPTKPRSVPVAVGKPLSTDAGNDKDTIRKFDVDVPGVKVDDLRVQVDEGEKLVITGKRKRGENTAQIRRAFTLDSNAVDIDKLTTFLEDGVLTVHVPVKAPREGRVIRLNVDAAQTDHNSISAMSAEESEDSSKPGNGAHHENSTNEVLHNTQAEETANSKAPEKESTDGAADEIPHTTTLDEKKDETDMDFEVVPNVNEEENSNN